MAEALYDHVDHHSCFSHLLEHVRRHARRVRHVVDRHPGLRLVERNVVDGQVFHALQSGHHVECVGRTIGWRTWRRHVIGRIAIQLEDAVDDPQRLLHLGVRHQHRDFDLAGGNHQDVDAGIGQGAEHAMGHARLMGHAEADDGNFCHAIVEVESLGADLLDGLGHRVQRCRQVFFQHGERNVSQPLVADVLHDHVDRDVLTGDAGKHFHAAARPIGYANDRDPGFVLGHRRAADRAVERLGLIDDHRAGDIAEAAANVDRHAKFLGEFDRPAVHHA